MAQSPALKPVDVADPDLLLPLLHWPQLHELVSLHRDDKLDVAARTLH